MASVCLSLVVQHGAYLQNPVLIQAGTYNMIRTNNQRTMTSLLMSITLLYALLGLASTLAINMKRKTFPISKPRIAGKSKVLNCYIPSIFGISYKCWWETLREIIHIWWGNPWFPVEFPNNQPNDYKVPGWNNPPDTRSQPTLNRPGSGSDDRSHCQSTVGCPGPTVTVMRNLRQFWERPCGGISIWQTNHGKMEDWKSCTTNGSFSIPILLVYQIQ